MTDEPTDRVAEAATDVPREMVAAAAAAVEDAPRWSPASQSAMIAASPATHYR